MSALWLLIGVVWAAQNTVYASLRGEPMSMAAALSGTLVQSLPWIPVTLAVVYITTRYPFRSGNWLRRLPIHIFALLTVAFLANLLVVLGFWYQAGSWNGWAALMRGGAYWATVRLHVALLIYIAIAALTQFLMYYRETRERELRWAVTEGQLARARLQVLNAQIRPHFLFNTLHTIGQLWRSGRSDDADTVLDHLGSLFHKVQNSTAQVEVPLADEIEMVTEYLAIEQMRFRDRMHTDINVSTEALECMLPPLLLQPLVENAVRHGISAASSAGRVEVNCAVTEGRLILEVRDDGPGMAAPSTHSGTGTGLSNTRERLQHLYGDSAQLAVQSTRAGTTIRITMPVRPSNSALEPYD